MNVTEGGAGSFACQGRPQSAKGLMNLSLGPRNSLPHQSKNCKDSLKAVTQNMRRLKSLSQVRRQAP